jgi:hypothetical protein
MDWKTRRQSHNRDGNGCERGEQIAHVILSVVMVILEVSFVTLLWIQPDGC